MSISAMPEWIKPKSAGTGTDWDWWGQRWWNKAWFCYGPRATEWYAKWREFPMIIFAIRSRVSGVFRVETEDWTRDSGRERPALENRYVMDSNIRLTVDDGPMTRTVQGYLSAIQYWTKWHIQLQWPFFFAFHFYIGSVPPFPDHAGDRRVIYFRIGARRDADKCYWFPSVFLGLRWN